MRGYTLLELVVVLTLVAATAASLAPAARRYRDRASVVAAREAVAGLLSAARVTALEVGSASVHLAGRPWRAWSTSGDSVLRSVPLESDLGVTVHIGGARSSVEISYNALGLGRMSAATLEFRRGDARAAMVVSGYGRIRRR